MPPHANRSPARLLAPIALVAVALAAIVILLGSGDGSDSGSTGTTAGKTQTQTTATRTAKRSYTVKEGDTLGGIAVKTGITVETLQDLNPELDPQALVSGQKIKLRQ
jgi:LysM repeat protein